MSITVRETAYEGETVGFWVEFANRGPSDASAATLQITLSGAETGGWSTSLGYISVGAAQLPRYFERRFDAIGTVTITAEISSEQPDPLPENNVDSDSIEVVLGGPADLSVDAQLPTNLTVGQETNFSVTLDNFDGPATARSVTFTMTVSSNLEIFDYSSPSCSTGRTQIVCEFSLISSRTGFPEAVRIRPIAPGPATLTADVSSSDNPDPDLSNKADTASAEVQPSADLQVEISESADPVKSKRDLVLTGVITNAGPSTATLTSLRHELTLDGLQSLTIVSVTPSQGSCTTSATAVSCELGPMDSGAGAPVAMTVRSRGTGTLISQAQVTAAEPDPDSANNTASESTRVSSSGR